MRLQKNRLAVAVSVALGVVSLNAAAAKLEEVVVTAQKRAEMSQNVPISIQAFSGKDLTEGGIDSSQDLGTVTPGLDIQQSGVGTTIFMRGMGNQDATGGQEGSVGVYVDGVWYGSVTGAALTLSSIDRVEVLKGPQGTLFGRNTTGGVINVITRDPSYETSGRVSYSYGNYERQNAAFYGTTGITDDVAADVALSWSDQGEGYGENLTTGNDVNRREDSVYARSKWKYSNDSTDYTFAFSYEKYADDIGNARGVPKGYVDAAGNSAPGDVHDFRNTVDPWADFVNKVASLTIDHSFESMEFVSITGYVNNDLESFADNDYSNADIYDARVDFYNEAFTQELRLASDNDSNISWIGGLFFLDSRAGSDITVSGPALWYNPATLAYTGLNDLRFYGDIDTTSYAAFGEARFELTDKQTLTLGARLTYDKREISGANQFLIFTAAPLGKFNGIPTPVAPTPDMEESWSEPTYRLVYDYQLTDEVMAYASYNRGFRSGNFNAVSPGNPAFKPEFVDAYEVGMKSLFAGGTVRLNGALFYYDVTDLQFQTLEGLTAQTINAAGASITGAEVDIAWQATDNLTLTAGASFIDSEYEDFVNALSNPPLGTPGPSPLIIDASGNQLTKTPEFEASLGLTYQLPTPTGTYRTDLRVGYSDGFPWEPDGRLEQDAFAMVNLSLGWKSPSDTWGVKLIGKNLLDEDYAVHQASSAPGDFYAAGEPRTVAIEASYDF